MMTRGLAARDRRKKSDFIAITHRMVAPDVLVIDGDKNIRGHGKVSEARPYIVNVVNLFARNTAFGLAHALAQAGKEFHLDHDGFFKG